MAHKLLLIATAAASLAACAPTTSHPVTATRMAASSGCSAPREAATDSGTAWLVEGFGGRGETQLMVTERRPSMRCALPSGAVTTATLAPRR